MSPNPRNFLVSYQFKDDEEGRTWGIGNTSIQVTGVLNLDAVRAMERQILEKTKKHTVVIIALTPLDS